MGLSSTDKKPTLFFFALCRSANLSPREQPQTAHHICLPCSPAFTLHLREGGGGGEDRGACLVTRGGGEGTSPGLLE
jgi:hypothetical protein